MVMIPAALFLLLLAASALQAQPEAPTQPQTADAVAPDAAADSERSHTDLAAALLAVLALLLLWLAERSSDDRSAAPRDMAGQRGVTPPQHHLGIRLSPLGHNVFEWRRK